MGRTRAPALLIGPLLTNRCRTDARPARCLRGQPAVTPGPLQVDIAIGSPMAARTGAGDRSAPVSCLENWDWLGGKSIALHFRSSRCPVSCLASQCCGARRYPKRWALSARRRHPMVASERLWFRRRSAGVVVVELAAEFVEEVAGGGGMVVAVFSSLTVMQTGRLAVGGKPKRPTSSRRWRAGCS
jgi:hypothetical protein